MRTVLQHRPCLPFQAAQRSPCSRIAGRQAHLVEADLLEGVVVGDVVHVLVGEGVVAQEVLHAAGAECDLIVQRVGGLPQRRVPPGGVRVGWHQADAGACSDTPQTQIRDIIVRDAGRYVDQVCHSTPDMLDPAAIVQSAMCQVRARLQIAHFFCSTKHSIRHSHTWRLLEGLQRVIGLGVAPHFEVLVGLGLRDVAAVVVHNLDLQTMKRMPLKTTLQGCALSRG